MSPRAASRLESLGFREAYDYAAGKADWFAAGLPMEGPAGRPSTQWFQEEPQFHGLRPTHPRHSDRGYRELQANYRLRTLDPQLRRRTNRRKDCDGKR